MPLANSTTTIASRLLAWYDNSGRKDLPWQQPRTSYRVWVSEIMLQQTQVQTVIPYFQRFVTEVPNLADLAQTSLDRVLGLWSGLGYYSRARNLHNAAKFCLEHYSGELPHTFDQLVDLPGIGRSTAGAILAQAFDTPHAILDGNVKRVLARYHGVSGWAGTTAVQQVLWRHAEAHTPTQRVAHYTQAIMDLGALVCTRSKPRCKGCPLSADCVAYREGLTASLPTSKSAKRVPTRQTSMLIVRDKAGRILLERRPPTGVWAQLWSLPESQTIDVVKTYKGLHLHKLEILPAFTHTFSHFRLEIQPVLFSLDKTDIRVADDPDCNWYTLTQLTALGLPAPVRKLLDNVMKES